MIEQSFRITQHRERPERPTFSPRTAQKVVFVVFLFVAMVLGMSLSAPTPDR